MGVIGAVAGYFIKLSLVVSSVALGVALHPTIPWVKLSIVNSLITLGCSLSQYMTYKTKDSFADIATATSFYNLVGDQRADCIYTSQVTAGLVGTALALNIVYFHIFSWKRGNLNIRRATTEVSIVVRLTAFLVILFAIVAEIAAMAYYYTSTCLSDFKPSEKSSI
jgi:hypothetical protein